MSLIPSTAIGASLVPVQHSNNELIRARRVQTDKDYHHSEEVEELDDTAVNSIDDNPDGGEKQEREEERPAHQKRDEERVEIASLKGARSVGRLAAKKGTAERLDISA